MQLKKAEQRFRLATADYAHLAEFRAVLRRFLHFSEAAAQQLGLTSQHYQAMLILRGWPEGGAPTIGDLAQQLLIKHNSAVGLTDRLVQEKLVVRNRSKIDGRKVELSLSTRGRHVLAKLAQMHRHELRRIGPLMGQFFEKLAAQESGR